MNEADNRKARAGSVADRGPATISVPAEDLVGEAQAAQSVHARSKLHATCWHLEDLCSARCVEHVRPLEEARERLAVLAVADEAEDGVRRNFARDTAHAATPAAQRKVMTSRRGDIAIIACHQRPATGGATLRQRAQRALSKDRISLRRRRTARYKLLERWSEWQDLNLRPPRPERGVLSRPL